MAASKTLFRPFMSKRELADLLNRDHTLNGGVVFGIDGKLVEIQARPLDPPWLVGVSQPALGAQFQVRVGSFAAVDNFLFAGFSTTQWQSFALPFDLAAFGTWPNCWLRVSTDLTLHLGFGQTATWSLAIPNTTSLLGAQLHLQGITIGQGSFPTNVSLSNAGTIVVGAL